MRCESNLKVKVDRKQGHLIAYQWSRVVRIRNTVKTFSEGRNENLLRVAEIVNAGCNHI